MPNIDGTTIPVEFLEEKLQKYFKTDEKIDNATITKSNNVGTGCVTQIVPLKIIWKENKETLPKFVLLKILNTESRSSVIGNDWNGSEGNWPQQAHINECHIYEKYGHLEDFPLLKVYHIQAVEEYHGEQRIPPVIIMDFIPYACHGDVVKGFTPEQVRIYIKNIVRLHAYNLTEPVGWEENYPFKRAHMLEVFKLMNGILNRLQDIQPGRYEKKLAKVMPIINPDNLVDDCFNSHTSLGLPPVIAHGDVWLNNMLWKKSINDCRMPSTDYDLIGIIDWQICRPGNFMEDLTLLLARTMNAEMRAQYRNEFFQYYLKELRRNLQEFGVDSCPFTIEDCIKAYDRMMPFALNGALIAVPFICEWNCKNMNENERESLFVNLDDLLDYTIDKYNL